MTRDSRQFPRLARPVASFVRRSLRTRMAAAFVGAAVVTVFVASGISYTHARRALRTAVSERLTGVANRRVTDVSRWITLQSQLVRFIAEIPSLNADVIELSSAHSAKTALNLETQRRVIALLDSAKHAGVSVLQFDVLAKYGGKVLASTNRDEIGSYHVDELYFKQGLKGPVIQNIYPAKNTGRPTMTAAVPVRRADGTAEATLTAHLDLRQMDDIVIQASGNMPIEVYLIDRFSDFVSSERFGRANYRRGGHSPGIDSALAGKNGTGLYLNYAGVPVIGAYRWIPESELAIMVESPQETAFAPARNLLITVLFIGIGAVLLLTVLAYRIAGHVAEPILSVARSAERVAQGDFDAQAEVLTDDEVGVLAKSFNQMTQHLRSLVGHLNEQVSVTRSALEALGENQQLLQGVVDNSAMLVTVIDFDGRFVLVNRHFESVFVRRREEVVGRAVEDVLAEVPAARMQATMAAVRDEEQVVEREITLPTSLGERTFLFVSFPLRHADGSAYAAGLVASDITERQRSEEERRQLEAQMQHSQKLESLGVLAGGIAHDFNNILGAVQVNAELALDDVPEKARHNVEQVLIATRRASELTRQMLAYAGKASLERTNVDLNRVIRELLELAKVTFSKKVALQVEHGTEPCWIMADPAQISQVVLNLLTNAAEAIGDRIGRVVLRTRLVAARSENGLTNGNHSYRKYDVRLTVSDSGCGMSDETKRRIFEPFFTTKESGRGLGLAAVIGIVKSVGGTLTVDSAVGAGTTFDIRFPACQPPVVRESTPAFGSSAATGGCVLVVDDEAMLRSVACRALARAGFDVIEAVDGVEGVRLFLENRDRISAIVLDMTMPGLDGAEVLRRIRDHDADVPVVVASGYDARNTAAARGLDQSVEFLQKPFGIGDLVAAVTRGAVRVRA